MLTVRIGRREQLAEGLGQLDVFDVAVTVEVEGFEESLVDLPADAWWGCRIVPVQLLATVRARSS
ncbi:MAG: hypothetical protein LC799_03530 [Actinobacteria bacterium]|nr:hypothetical protein [Actinomycetota bacterium]